MLFEKFQHRGKKPLFTVTLFNLERKWRFFFVLFCFFLRCITLAGLHGTQHVLDFQVSTGLVGGHPPDWSELWRRWRYHCCLTGSGRGAGTEAKDSTCSHCFSFFIVLTVFLKSGRSHDVNSPKS